MLREVCRISYIKSGLLAGIGIEDIAVSVECCGGTVWAEREAGAECGDGFLLQGLCRGLGRQGWGEFDYYS
jgi:hypothetical protein